MEFCGDAKIVFQLPNDLFGNKQGKPFLKRFNYLGCDGYGTLKIFI
jgi:hypothetical protein